MAVDPDDIDLADLDAIYERHVSKDKALRVKRIAAKQTNAIFGDSVARLPEVEGDEDDFTLWLWAALLEERYGEESSESQSGGSVSYSRMQLEEGLDLPNNRFGRVAASYLRSERIGIVKGTSNFR